MIEALLDCNLSPGFLDEVAANPSTDRHPQLTTESWLPESDLKAFAVQEHKSAPQASETERSHIRESCEYSGIEGLTPAAAVEQILRTVDDLSGLGTGETAFCRRLDVMSEG